MIKMATCGTFNICLIFRQQLEALGKGKRKSLELCVVVLRAYLKYLKQDLC